MRTRDLDKNTSDVANVLHAAMGVVCLGRLDCFCSQLKRYPRIYKNSTEAIRGTMTMFLCEKRAAMDCKASNARRSRTDESVPTFLHRRRKGPRPEGPSLQASQCRRIRSQRLLLSTIEKGKIWVFHDGQPWLCCCSLMHRGVSGDATICCTDQLKN